MIVAHPNSAINETGGKTTFSAETIVTEAPPSNTEDSASSKDVSADLADAKPTAEDENQADPNSDPTKVKPDSSQPESEKKAPSNDPIRWFGVLVPPALRSAQTSFVSAIEGPVVELSIFSKELRQQEIEIGRVRKQIKKL